MGKMAGGEGTVSNPPNLGEKTRNEEENKMKSYTQNPTYWQKTGEGKKKVNRGASPSKERRYRKLAGRYLSQ